MKRETSIPLTASIGFALALMLASPTSSMELIGIYNSSETLKAFRRIGNAELDNGQIVGTIVAPDGANLRYTAHLMCESKDACDNIVVSYDLELPSKRAAFCLIDAWGDPKDKFGARPVFNFSAVRFMKDVTGLKGSSSPSADKIATEWKTEMVDFHSLVQSGKC